MLSEVYEGIGWEVPRLLEMMPSAPDSYFDVAAQICMAHWSQGRVALVGDAAYCASPMSGQGTGLALIGAYVLAGELAAASGAHHIAFDQYEKELRPLFRPHQVSSHKMRQRDLWLSQGMNELGKSLQSVGGRSDFIIASHSPVMVSAYARTTQRSFVPP